MTLILRTFPLSAILLVIRLWLTSAFANPRCALARPSPSEAGRSTRLQFESMHYFIHWMLYVSRIRKLLMPSPPPTNLYVGSHVSQCYRSDQYCSPGFRKYYQNYRSGNVSLEEGCAECALKTWQAMLNSDFSYRADLVPVFSSIISSWVILR